MNIRITAYHYSKLGIRNFKDFKSSVKNGNIMLSYSSLFFLVWLSFSISILRFDRVVACVIIHSMLLPSSTVCSSVPLRIDYWVVSAYRK